MTLTGKIYKIEIVTHSMFTGIVDESRRYLNRCSRLIDNMTKNAGFLYILSVFYMCAQWKK